MTLTVLDLVAQTTTGTGTGNLTLVDLTGYRHFADAFGTGASNQFYYAIRHVDTVEYEIGYGHMSSASLFVRDTVLKSSNANTFVNFSVGTKEVACDVPAELQLVAGYTDEQAQDAIGAMIDGSLTYVDGTPLLQRSALTGDITASAGSNMTTLATVNSNVGSFGNASNVSTVTVNAKGLVTAASNTAISITSSGVSDFTEAAQDAVGGALTDSASVDFTYSDAGNTITAAVLPAGIDHNSLANLTVGNVHTQYGLKTGAIYRADVAVIWPDGTGTHANLAAAVADTAISVAVLMPNQSGGTVVHTINNSAGALSITREFHIHGFGTETNATLIGTNSGNNLITSSSTLIIDNVFLGNCAIAVTHTTGGNCYLRRCQGGDGATYFVTTLLDNTGGKAYIQNTVVPLPLGTVVLSRSSSVSLIIEQSNFILGSGIGIDISAASEQVEIVGCTFFGAFNPAIKITSSPLYTLSRSNTYQNSAVAISINGTGSSNVFDSQGDICVGGTTNISINTANTMTYRFRNGSFDSSKITIGAGQRKVQNYVDQNAGMYSDTLKSYTDVNIKGTVTCAMNSNMIGTILSGLGSQVLTLNPTVGSASAIGSLKSAATQTATVNFHGAAGGLFFGNIDLSGASAITGTVQDSGTYNVHIGSVVGTGTLNGLVDFQGKYCFNAGNIQDGGTITFGSTTRGATFHGLAQNGGIVTLSGYGNIFGLADGSTSSLIAGASGTLGTVFGQVIKGGSTETISIEATGSSSIAGGYLDFTGTTYGGTSFSKATGAGSVCFFSNQVTDSDQDGTLTVNMQGLASGIGSVCFAAAKISNFEISSSTYNIKATSSNLGSAIVGCYLQATDSTTLTVTATASGNASALVGVYCQNGIANASGAASAIVGSAALGGFTIATTSTGTFIGGSAAVAANVTAAGLGSGLFAYTSGGVVATTTATASYGFFGTVGGTNAQTNSLQLGVLGAGLRFMLSTTAPTTPTNGDIRQNSSGYMFNFSGGFGRLMGMPYIAKTANYTTTLNDFTVDCTSNTFTVTLLTAVANSGTVFVIKNSGTGTITVATTSSQTIDGVSTLTLTQGQSRWIQSDNANWKIIGGY